MFEGMFEIFNEEKDEDKGTEITRPGVGYSSTQASAYSSSNLFVLSIGGSIIADGKPNQEMIAAISDCLNELIRSGYKLVLVVGGGKIARDYVKAAKSLGANNFELDELGIKITRVNASLLLSTIENAFPEILAEVKPAKDVLAKGKTPIYGGLMPGFTTDAVAALLAEYLNGTFVNLSNVDGIYTADPAAFPSARLYHQMAYGKLLEILTSNAMKPAQNLILDLPAAMILKRSGLTAYFLNGHDLANFKNAVQGLEFKGTVVRPDAEDAIEGEEEVPRRKRHASRRKTVKKKPARRKTVRFYEGEDEELDPDKIDF